MAKLTRREFLLSLATVPFLRLAIPQVMGNILTMPARQNQTGEPAGSGQPNILFVLFDTFSAQHMSLFGYERETTPNIARAIGQGGTVYHQHYAGGNFTTPATASLLTGLYPWTHRSLQSFGHVLERYSSHNLFQFVPDTYYKVAYTHNSLAAALLHLFQDSIDEYVPRRELTRADGIVSDTLFARDYPVAIHAERLIQGANINSSLTFFAAINKLHKLIVRENLEEEYRELFPRGLPGGNFHALYLLEDAMDWIIQQSTTLPNPYMLYVHLLPPHAPYAPRADFVGAFDDNWHPPVKPETFDARGHTQESLDKQRRFYNEYIGYVDAEFGRLFDTLKSSGALDNTYLVLTSDHGELFERGILGHTTRTLYEGLTHIPLVIWKPGETTQMDVQQRTSCVDVVPTLLSMTGQPIPATCEGVILPTFPGAPNADRPIFSVEAKLNNKFAPLTKSSVALYQDDYKLVQYAGYKDLPGGEPMYELFNIRQDPDELTNLYDVERSLAGDLRQILQEKLVAADQPFQRG